MAFTHFDRRVFINNSSEWPERSTEFEMFHSNGNENYLTLLCVSVFFWNSKLTQKCERLKIYAIEWENVGNERANRQMYYHLVLTFIRFAMNSFWALLTPKTNGNYHNQRVRRSEQCSGVTTVTAIDLDSFASGKFAIENT